MEGGEHAIGRSRGQARESGAVAARGFPDLQSISHGLFNSGALEHYAYDFSVPGPPASGAFRNKTVINRHNRKGGV